MRTSRAVAAVGFVCLTGCISPERFQEVDAARAKLVDQRDDLARVNREQQTLLDRLQAEVNRLAPLVTDAAYLKKQKALVDSILRRFNQEGGPKLPAGVTPVQVEGGLALRVEGRILFGSGSDDLSDIGQSTLKQLVDAVRSHPGDVRIAGHTDADPIKHSKWKTNMRLSVARALTVREYLVSLGLPEDKMSVAGYGEFEPVAGDDKSKNRRTEIVLLR